MTYSFTRAEYEEMIQALDDLVMELDSRIDSITEGDESPSKDNVGYLSEARTHTASACHLLTVYLTRRDNPVWEEA